MKTISSANRPADEQTFESPYCLGWEASGQASRRAWPRRCCGRGRSGDGRPGRRARGGDHDSSCRWTGDSASGRRWGEGQEGSGVLAAGAGAAASPESETRETAGLEGSRLGDFDSGRPGGGLQRSTRRRREGPPRTATAEGDARGGRAGDGDRRGWRRT